MEETNTPRTPWSEIVGLVAELDPKLELAPVGRQMREITMEKPEMTPEVRRACATLVEVVRESLKHHEERFCRLVNEFEDLTGRRYDAMTPAVKVSFLERLEAALEVLRETPPTAA